MVLGHFMTLMVVKLMIQKKLGLKHVMTIKIHVIAKLKIVNVVTPEKRETQDNLNIEIN